MFFGSRHFFTGFPVKRIDIVTGQSIEVSSDYASCLCLMRKVSIAKRVGHMPSPTLRCTAHSVVEYRDAQMHIPPPPPPYSS